MKKILSLLLISCFCSLALFADDYVVFKVRGNVTKVVDGENIALKPRENLELRTVLNIPEDAQISILNRNTKQLFRSLKPGKATVSKILKEARKQSDAVVRSAGGVIRKSLSEGTAGNTHKQQGSILRGDGESMSIEFIVANALKTGNYSSECPVSFSRKYNADSTYVYEINSQYPGALYVNIADISVSPAVLLFDVSYGSGEPFVTVGNGTTLIDAFEFYGDDNRRLVLVAANYPFDVQAVQAILKGKNKTGEKTKLPDGVQVWVSAKH